MSQPAPTRADWDLAEELVYLNHGSFGPSPRVVVEERAMWQARLEANPMDFFVRELRDHLHAAQVALGRFVGTAAENLALVDNATFAMNVVADSFPLAAGDEVLTTDHDYGAVQRIWNRACHRAGARLVVAPLSMPFSDTGQLIDRMMEKVTPRTRLLVFSHITSPTAVIFPARELSHAARQKGLAVCIDGPHALAQLDVRIDQLDCDYYTASCHKWLCAPFGAGFLYIHPRAQHDIVPPMMSWGRPLDDSTVAWQDEFHWAGTRDPAPSLAIPAAIRFMERAGLAAFRQTTHALARYARTRISELTGLVPCTPDSETWYGSMVAVPLSGKEEGAAALQRALWERHRIEAPIVPWQGGRLIRVSCHWYTSEGEIDRLVEALKAEL